MKNVTLQFEEITIDNLVFIIALVNLISLLCLSYLILKLVEDPRVRADTTKVFAVSKS